MTGTRPSGGSTTIDVRFALTGLSWSAQCAGGFTFGIVPSGPVVSDSNGVLSKLTHVPRRSGWPSGVRCVHASGACAYASTPIRAPAAAATEAERRCFMRPPPAFLILLLYRVAASLRSWRKHERRVRFRPAFHVEAP